MNGVKFSGLECMARKKEIHEQEGKLYKYKYK